MVLTRGNVPLSAQRRIVHALLVSFACHVLFLAFAPGLRSPLSVLSAAQTLDVRLLAPPQAPIAAPAPEPALPQPAPRARAVKPVVAPVVSSRHRADPQPAQTAPPAVAAAPPPAEPALLSAPAAAAQPSAPVQALAPPVVQPEEAPQDGLLIGYGRQLTQALKADERYPRVALMRGWQGMVKLRIRFLPGGQRGEVSIVRSSGYPVLDETAVEMASSADLPRAPDGLRRRAFYLDVPVVFRLTGTQRL